MSYKLEIQNIVASVTLGIEIPLEKLVERVEGVEYEPEQFPGLVYRLKKPKTASLIFSSGKIVCTGARSMKEVKEAVKKVVNTINRHAVRVPKKFKVEIQNIVASAKFDKRLNLDHIAFTLENSEYEPEQFPGLVYRMDNPNVAFLLFSSGKIVCTGGKTIKDVKTAIEKLERILKRIKAFV